MEIERETVTQDPQTGNTEAVRTQEKVPSESAVSEHHAIKAGAYVWYVVGVLNVLIALRFVFLLLGAKNTGFTASLYQVTHPLIAPFAGIFSSPGSDTGYFDTASILAIAVYLLIAWGIVALIDISLRDREV
ncbi:MAG: YggT family protein [bacterium]